MTNIINKATRVGEVNPLVKDHIPTMLGHIDPPYLTCTGNGLKNRVLFENGRSASSRSSEAILPDLLHIRGRNHESLQKVLENEIVV